MTLSAQQGCPFSRTGRLLTGQERVRVLYEEYIHLGWLRQVWNNPVTQNPVLEPCFSAAFHGIELCFLLMADFVSDSRLYVAKRPRIERVANDIRAQCQLLCEMVDGELEEEGPEVAEPPRRATLTQAFPFEGCPPTTRRRSQEEAPQSGGGGGGGIAKPTSPGLARLAAAVKAALPHMITAEQNSFIKVVLNISAAFSSSFARWTVGLGIEAQLNDLLASLGLPRTVVEHEANLDYGLLVQPQVVERTFTEEVYTNAEDFFFRSIHLGTECWIFVALNRLHGASERAAAGCWHVAAARTLQAASILRYLGDHVMMLTSMNLRDYLLLKVELEGTSGAGSSQVKAARTAVLRLLEPLRDEVLKICSAAADLPAVVQATAGIEDVAAAEGPADAAFERCLMTVYECPDKYSGLYSYAKSLEDVEGALLGGFYYQHFRLAATVIGSDARGTMKRAVMALKSTYETAVFPVLDLVRSKLGAKVDQELVHVKGRIMDGILAKYKVEHAA